MTPKQHRANLAKLTRRKVNPPAKRKHRRSVWTISAYPFWWAPSLRRWVKIEPDHPWLSSHAHARNRRQALRIVGRVPAGVAVTVEYSAGNRTYCYEVKK